MRFASIFLALATGVVYTEALNAAPRYITTTTQIGGLCWSNTQGAPVTATQAGVTSTVSVPEVSSTTATEYVYPTQAAKRDRYPPYIAREETTIVVSDVCASTTTLTLHATNTVTDTAVTTTTTAYESTYTSTYTYTLCVDGHICG